MTAPVTALSVIIPTYNRAALLRDALETLVAQDAPDGLFEVVVVDDGSTDATPGAARRFEDRLPLRVVRQENAGLNVARNTGAEAATAPVLAFLDDDVLLPPDWARQVVDAFTTNPEADAAAGRVVLRFEAPPPSWLTARLHSYLSAFEAGPEPGWLAPPEFPRGAHALVRRDAWARIGGFLPDLDRKGASLVSSGDKEFFLRLRRSGGRILWWPAAWLYHRVHPERLSRAWFRRRAFAQGLGDGLMESPSNGRSTAALLAREVVRLGRAVPILGSNLARGRGTLTADLWVRFCVGRMRGMAGPRLNGGTG